MMSLVLIAWFCVKSKRRSRRKRGETELNDLFAQKGWVGVEGREAEDWEKRARRDRFWRQREKRERQRKERKYGFGKVDEIELDGFGRAVGLQEPKRARIREWKMWSLP